MDYPLKPSSKESRHPGGSLLVGGVVLVHKAILTSTCKLYIDIALLDVSVALSTHCRRMRLNLQDDPSSLQAHLGSETLLVCCVARVFRG